MLADIPTWLILIWLIVLVLAVLSRSLIMTMALIFIAMGAAVYTRGLVDMNDTARWAMIIVFYLSAGFAVLQLLYRVENI